MVIKNSNIIISQQQIKDLMTDIGIEGNLLFSSRSCCENGFGVKQTNGSDLASSHSAMNSLSHSFSDVLK